MAGTWRKELATPPVRCSDCGRIYPEGSGMVNGRVEIFTDGDRRLCVTCAVQEGVLPHAPRRG